MSKEHVKHGSSKNQEMDSIWVCLVNGYDVENVCPWQKVLRCEIS
jgi:hypothetical protein